MMTNTMRQAPRKPSSQEETKPLSKRAPLPPTISRPTLMVDGSDALVRRITHLHFILSGMLDGIRGGFASLIGVTSFQYVLMQALGRLHSKTEWTVGSVAREMHMTDAYVSTEIADLVEQGYLAKIVNPADRRVSFLTLTEKGRDALAAIAPIQQSVNDTLYSHLNETSAVAYAAALEGLVTQAEGARRLLHDVSAGQRIAALKPPGAARRPRRTSRQPDKR